MFHICHSCHISKIQFFRDCFCHFSATICKLVFWALILVFLKSLTPSFCSPCCLRTLKMSIKALFLHVKTSHSLLFSTSLHHSLLQTWSLSFGCESFCFITILLHRFGMFSHQCKYYFTFWSLSITWHPQEETVSHPGNNPSETCCFTNCTVTSMAFFIYKVFC